MRWKDVNYLSHGLEAIVVKDNLDPSPGATPNLVRVRGVIECPGYDDFPSLKTPDGAKHIFYQAVVLLVPPRGA